MVHVTQMLGVVNVTEEFMLELWLGNMRDGTVLVQNLGVAHQTWGEVSKVGGQLLYHVSSHLIAPYYLYNKTGNYSTPSLYQTNWGSS